MNGSISAAGHSQLRSQSMGSVDLSIPIHTKDQMFYFVFIFQTCSVMAFLLLVNMLLVMPLGMKGAVKMFLQDTLALGMI